METGVVVVDAGLRVRLLNAAARRLLGAAPEAGASLAEQGLASYWIDVHVSDGTNTKDEKAAYLAAVFARMAELIGPLHNETYLHVDEVKADAYGFGGLSQERRYVAAQLGVSPQRGAA